ncbi:MAG: hypothetical protein KGD63_04505 [Candidatus Lokiarchaeota archaeon]|nr:hypothetical protein [Candidatus Lokiarchaeota archaeon]
MKEFSSMDKVFLGLTRQGKIPYTPMISISLEEKLDIGVLKSVCQRIWHNYPILQSTIKYEKKNAKLIENTFNLDDYFFDLEKSSPYSSSDFFSEIGNKAYDPKVDPLVYIYTINTVNEFFLIIRWHHSIFDGLSAFKLIGIILNAYIDKINNRKLELEQLERLTISKLIFRSTHFRYGKKIPSKISLRLHALSSMLSILKKKLFDSYEGPFNMGEFQNGRVSYSSIQLDSKITENFKTIKNNLKISENEIIVAIILKSYFTWSNEKSKNKARLTLVMDIRPKNKINLLGNLMVPLYVDIKKKHTKSNNLLLKKIKKQMDKNKNSIGPIATQCYIDGRGLSLKKINKHTKISFRIANVQLSNIGSLTMRLSEKIKNNLKIKNTECLILPKPGLTSVITSVKTYDTINIGISYIEDLVSTKEIKEFLNIIKNIAINFA